MKKIFIITGDYSGDIHAANVVKAIKANSSDVLIEGIGGENLKAQGVKLFSDQKKMGAVGLSFKIIWEHLTLGKRLVDYLRDDYKPDLVLLIDYGVFNLSVSKFLKKEGIKVFYYIPPQVWASRKWRINTIKKNVDEVLCIFPFEKHPEVMNSIQENNWMIRKALGTRVKHQLRHVPELAFYVDDSLEYISGIDKLLKQ